MNNARSTVGDLSQQLIQKSSDNTHSAHEQMLEQLSDYDRNIYECVERGKKELANDFFVTVLTKKEKLLENVLRNYFYFRITCPTPDYDQAVYRYIRKEDIIEFVWVIPSRDACFHLKDKALEIAPEEKQILDFVLQFSDGSLYKLAKKLNGEKEDSIIIEGR
jgi:hypothetical protein